MDISYKIIISFFTHFRWNFRNLFHLRRFQTFFALGQLKQIIPEDSFNSLFPDRIPTDIYEGIHCQGFLLDSSVNTIPKWRSWKQFAEWRRICEHETLLISIKILDNVIDQESETQNWVFDFVVCQGNSSYKILFDVCWFLRNNSPAQGLVTYAIFISWCLLRKHFHWLGPGVCRIKNRWRGIKCV